MPAREQKNAEPIIVFNHRWEYDKNPEGFFEAIQFLKNQGHSFKLSVLGEQFDNQPAIFEKAKKQFADNILFWGYAENRQEYLDLLWQADIAITTSLQDFFGISFLEAIACECFALFPGRLTYPELVPEQFHKCHLYTSQEDLNVKAAQVLKDWANEKSNALSATVERFDIEHLIREYDAAFSQIRISRDSVA